MSHKHGADMSPHELAHHIEQHHLGSLMSDPMAVPVAPGQHAENYLFHEDDHSTRPGPETPHEHDKSVSPYGVRPKIAGRN